MVDRSRKLGALHAREAATGHAGENVDREAAALAAMAIHETHLPHLIT
jgi:hypothetical protein